MIERWRAAAKRLKQLVNALAVASRDPRAGWAARIVIVCVLAYAASPIDLIPDIIPILGYLDDLILIPAGIALAIRLLPRAVWDDAVAQASTGRVALGGGRLVAGLIVLAWVLLALAAWWLGFGR